MLRSVCTSTLIPFFSVRVWTGNSCAAAGADQPAIAPSKTRDSNALHKLLFFISTPLPGSSCKTQKTWNRFSRIPRSVQDREDAHGPARAALQLDGCGDQECARFRQRAQVREVFK